MSWVCLQCLLSIYVQTSHLTGVTFSNFWLESFAQNEEYCVLKSSQLNISLTLWIKGFPSRLRPLISQYYRFGTSWPKWGQKASFGLRILDSSGWNFSGEKEICQVKGPQSSPSTDEYPKGIAKYLKKSIKQLEYTPLWTGINYLKLKCVQHYKWHFIWRIKSKKKKKITHHVFSQRFETLKGQDRQITKKKKKIENKGKR